MYGGINHFDINFQIFAAGTENQISINNDAFLTFGSMNTGEYIISDQNMTGLDKGIRTNQTEVK